MTTQFEFMRDQARAQQGKVVLNNKMNENFSQFVRSLSKEYNIKFYFKIPGRENTYHEFVWPQRGFLSKENANKILDKIDKIDKKIRSSITFQYHKNKKK